MVSAFYAFLLSQKLVMTVVSQNLNDTLLSAVKAAGAKGGTIVKAKGTAPWNHWSGSTELPEKGKGLLLTVVHEDLVDGLLDHIDQQLHLSNSSAGISFVIDLKQARGVIGSYEEIQEGIMLKKRVRSGYEMVITIVDEGRSNIVLEAARGEGATGGTVISGKGIGSLDSSLNLDIPITPEKEIVIILVESKKADKVMDSIMEKAEINQPGKGIALLLDVERTVGLHQ